MIRYDRYTDGEVISCSCFFDFWFWFINRKKNKYRTFNSIITSVDSEIIVEYFGKISSFFVLKKSHLDDGTQPFYLHKPADEVHEDFITWPCFAYSFCYACYKKVMMIVADNNQMSYEEVNRQSCKTVDYTYYEFFILKQQCSYCKLFNCFVRTAKLKFLTIDCACILAHNRFR